MGSGHNAHFSLGEGLVSGFANYSNPTTGATIDLMGQDFVFIRSTSTRTVKLPTNIPEGTIIRFESTTGTLTIQTSAGVTIVAVSAGQAGFTQKTNAGFVTVVLNNDGTISSTTLGDVYTTLTSTLGYIPLPLSTWRSIGSNQIPDANSAGAADASGGILASDSAPALIRVNTSTDKALRILWAGGSSVEITHDFVIPPDFDDTAAVKLNLLASMAGTSDAPELTIDTNMGLGQQVDISAFGPISGTTIALYSGNILSASEALPYPNFGAVSITPGTHATDALRLYGAWLTYTKKLLTS